MTEKLNALRSALTEQGVDGFILQAGDEHITEYPAPYSMRLQWLTGFRGSTASIAVLHDKAAIFIDGRYTIAVRHQVDGEHWSYEDVPQTSVGEWLSANAAPGAIIGFDPWLHTRSSIQAIEAKVKTSGVVMTPLGRNPIDDLWDDQPARPVAPMLVQPDALTGRSSAEKRQAIADWLSSETADACVIVALDSIAWLLNTRGHDIDIMPYTYAYAIVGRDGVVDLFVDETKVTPDVRQHLGNGVRVHAYEAFGRTLCDMNGSVVSVDPKLTPVAVYIALEAAGAKVREDRDPTVLPRAIKTSVEIEGIRAAHERDGAALTRFLHWFSIEAPKGKLTELSAAAKLNALRAEQEHFHSLSFPPISAFGANAALPHYSPTPETDAPIGPGIYLLDSGGQYPDGTTDITRTMTIGEPSAEARDRFTRVLKGHIGIGALVFPRNAAGFRLDAFARYALWQAGLDFAHGTGHGVGAFLGVHEGPQSLSSTATGGAEPIVAGMILTNEPGYYKAGCYGIRTENLMVAVPCAIADAEQEMLAFETVSLAPIDRRLIDVSLLTKPEIEWVDDYHAKVFEKLGPRVPPETRAWLAEETAPLVQ